MGKRYGKYLKVEGARVEIDEERVRKEARLDGVFGYWTNTELNAKELLEAYRNHWQVEDAFRCLKHTMKLRPMWHWTERRIEGHVMMAFLAFYVVRAMQLWLREKGLDYSVERMLEVLNEIYAVEFRDGENEYLLRTQITGEKNELLRALGVKIPPTILSRKPM